ncbi:MAG: hypothetical protein HC906_07735 [Bacteroidales bacterium]|nr:hypothetical protein [Bacteroidales bacterium]
MALKYKVISTVKPGSKKEDKRIWLPKLTGTSQFNLNELADIIQQRSTAHQADVILVIQCLMRVIPEMLLDGKTVKLDGFGVFRLHAKAETSETPEEVDVHNIKEIRLSFIPDPENQKIAATG